MILGASVLSILILVMFGIAFKANQSVRRGRSLSQVAQTSHSLNSFGYRQELLRDLGGFASFSVSFSVISILTGAVTLYGFGFNHGGAAMMGIGWPLVTLFVLMIAASMAELTSAIPTSGAVYHWSSILGGPGWGWFTGWMNLLGQVTILAAIDYGCAGFVGSLLFESPSQLEIISIYGLILTSHGILNHIGIRRVTQLNNFSAVYHIGGVLIILGVLVYFVPTRPLSYLFEFGSSTSSGNSKPYWFAFLMGLLQAQWTYTGFDASAHTSEETVDAEVRAPWGVFSSVAVSSVFGFLMLALVTLSIKEPEAVALAGNNAFRVAIEQAAGSGIGKLLIWIATLAMWFSGLSAVTASSRMVFALARDQGLPFSGQWAKISSQFQTPAYAIWLVLFLALLCGLGENIYAVVTSLSVIGLYSSYGIPILLRVISELKGAWTQDNFGPWNLGQFSFWINIISIAWIFFISILFVIAPNDIVLGKNFTLTYATGKIFAVACFTLWIWYFLKVRKTFRGPHLGNYQNLRTKTVKIWMPGPKTFSGAPHANLSNYPSAKKI